MEDQAEASIMRKTLLAAVTLSCIPLGAATADDGFVRQILSSGATTASTYMTFRDDKLVAAAREDASSFVASDGVIRGPYLEALLVKLRSQQPQLQASDMQLASAILAAEQTR
jgi:uncharacterized protein (TIGR02448 family)